MTPEEAIGRAFRAQQAIDEFIAPAFDALHNEYTARMKQVASTAPWEANKITALANATRILEVVRGEIELAVKEGEMAQAAKRRAERVENLSPSKRRLLNIGAF